MPELIEFLADEHALANCPAPYPAPRAVPDWLKDMPMDRGDIRTIKRCAPFLEAMTAGYIIPYPSAVSIHVAADGRYRMECQFPMVETHTPAEYQGTPFERRVVMKFLQPWLVRTPPGYSTLFVAPLNQFNPPFLPISGVVETDTYYDPVNIPSLCNVPLGQSASVERGAPMVQVIPFKRDTWDSSVAQWDEALRQQWRDTHQANPHAYKENYWVKKSFR
jgi:hypothetical protein